VTSTGLSYQIFGEITWLCVLEAQRFHFADFQSFSAAIDEIAGDLTASLADASVIARPDLAAIIRLVEDHYRSLSRQICDGRLGPEAIALAKAIRDGLAMNVRAPVLARSRDQRPICG